MASWIIYRQFIVCKYGIELIGVKKNLQLSFLLNFGNALSVAVTIYGRFFFMIRLKIY